MAVGLVRRAGATGRLLTPFHDKLRTAAVALLSEAELRRWNLRLADALEHHGEAEPEVLIDYLLVAGERQRAYALVQDAAARMDRGFAFERAAELCRLALELACEFAADRQQDARIALAEALVNCGRCFDAAQHFLEAARHASTEDADALSDAPRSSSSAEATSKRASTSRAARSSAWASSSRGTSVRAIPSIIWDRLRLWRRGYRYALQDDKQLSDEVLTRIDWCLNVGTVLPLVDTIRGFQVHNQGLRRRARRGRADAPRARPGDGGGLSQRAAPRQRRGGEGGGVVPQRRHPGRGHGRPDGARGGAHHARLGELVHRRLARVYRGRRRRHPHPARALPRRLVGGQLRGHAHARRDLVDGGLRRPRAHLRAELEDAIARGDRFAQLMYVVRDMMMNATVRDTLDAAEARADGVMEAFGDRGFQMEHLAELFERNHMALYRERGEVAYGLYTAAWKKIGQAQLMRLKPLRVETQSGRGRAALLLASSLPTGRRRSALIREAARLGDIIAAEAPDARTLVLGCPLTAGVAYLRGDVASAITRLERGIADARRTLMPAHELAFRHVLGRLTGGETGRTEGGDRPLRTRRPRRAPPRALHAHVDHRIGDVL